MVSGEFNTQMHKQTIVCSNSLAGHLGLISHGIGGTFVKLGVVTPVIEGRIIYWLVPMTRL